jgi:hypothetical protein
MIRTVDGTIKHFSETFSPGGAEHLACEQLRKKMLVSHLYDWQLRKFVQIFEEAQARESQYFVFRWLYDCVGSGILKEEDVDRSSPGLNLRRRVLMLLMLTNKIMRTDRCFGQLRIRTA